MWEFGDQTPTQQYTNSGCCSTSTNVIGSRGCRVRVKWGIPMAVQHRCGRTLPVLGNALGTVVPFLGRVLVLSSAFAGSVGTRVPSLVCNNYKLVFKISIQLVICRSLIFFPQQCWCMGRIITKHKRSVLCMVGNKFLTPLVPTKHGNRTRKQFPAQWDCRKGKIVMQEMWSFDASRPIAKVCE